MKLALLGGFLGSGKTTAVVEACTLMLQQGKKVGVITNDQGNQQVDSAFVRSLGITTREVSNGCFCCHFNELQNQLQWFKDHTLPDILFAESVGSCTDLIATLVKPLHEFQPELEVVVSVFADAGFVVSISEGRATFLDEDVRYIYKKQLQEADLIVLSKVDTITAEQRATAHARIQAEYPGKVILEQNSLNAVDIQHWLDVQHNFSSYTQRPSLDIDYASYGAGEARLAWLDKRVMLHTQQPDAVLVARKIIGSIFDHIQQHQLPIGHLKFFLEAGDWSEKISFTSISTSEHMQTRSAPHSTTVSLLINARVQTNPEFLKELVDGVLLKTSHAFGCAITDEAWAAFAPGFPKPTHRVG